MGAVGIAHLLFPVCSRQTICLPDLGRNPRPIKGGHSGSNWPKHQNPCQNMADRVACFFLIGNCKMCRQVRIPVAWQIDTEMPPELMCEGLPLTMDAAGTAHLFLRL